MDYRDFRVEDDFYDDLTFLRDDSQQIAEDKYVEKVLEIVNGYPCVGAPYEPTQVAAHMFIGTQRNAENIPGLRRLRITHVLNCGGGGLGLRAKQLYGADSNSGVIDYQELQAQDSEHYDITQHFAQARSFLDRCKFQNGRALVHCDLGINRSAAICIAYLLVNRRFMLLEAIHFLKTQRRVILNNEGFIRQLIKFARERGFLEDESYAVRVKRDFTMTKAYQNAFTFSKTYGLKYQV